MKDQARIFFLKPTSPAEMLANQNYLDELQDTKIKREIKTLHKSYKSLRKTQRNNSMKSKKKGFRRINV